MNSRRPAEEIDDEAARWVLRLDREENTETLEAELHDWLEEDSRHRGAMLRAQAAWALLDGAPLSAAAPLKENDEPRNTWVQRGRLRWPILGGLGVSIAAALAVIALLPPPDDDLYTTQVGELRRLALADRSTASLNTASAIDIDYDEDQRLVRIVKGEVWFQVTANKSRPFVVEAGRIRVQAVGTAFSVRRRGGGADILVTEGAVKAWVEGAEQKITRIEAGSQAFVAGNATITKEVAQPSELDRKLAWRAGKIDLAGETLATAVSEFNRYNVRQITVADAEIARERLYGVFRNDDPEGFARAASISLGATVSAIPDGDIVIASSSR